MHVSDMFLVRTQQPFLSLSGQMDIVSSTSSWLAPVTGTVLLHIVKFRWQLDHRLIYARMLVDMGNTFDVVVSSEELLTVVFVGLTRPRVKIVDSMIHMLRDGMQIGSHEVFMADEHLCTLPNMLERVLHMTRLSPLQQFPDTNMYSLTVEHHSMVWQFSVYKDPQLPLLYFWDVLPQTSALCRISTIYGLKTVLNLGLAHGYFPLILAQAMAAQCSTINIQLTVLNIDGALWCRYTHTVNIAGTWKALTPTQSTSLPALQDQIRRLMEPSNLVTANGHKGFFAILKIRQHTEG